MGKAQEVVDKTVEIAGAATIVAISAATMTATVAMASLPGLIRVEAAAARQAETAGTAVVRVAMRVILPIEAMAAIAVSRKCPATSLERSDLLAHPAIVRAKTVGLSPSAAIVCRVVHVTTSTA